MRGVLVGQCLRKDAARGRRFLNLLAVLVGPREKKDVVTREPMEARERVRNNRRVAVPDVRPIVDVVDRRRQVKQRRRR